MFEKLIIMECKVRAEPKPEITWYNDGVLVQESSKVKQTITKENGIYVIKLELRDTGVAESGTYKCFCQNEVGNATANLTLCIEGKVFKERNKLYHCR